ncbi:hypothetical protein FHX44_11547 [Pseudonocardia hierapolitana]|uniref:Uncharacterized protein n=1 Tax=Pseudonocardia hierapolitana TaxID=1128676 RepID=A0A561SIG1_9PSEU|nr:hypothetical protein [Pseudonocardia hierapolitana]TWF74666.1 hypothetical protein FHX44_11547 [Pseudonocardia hierapolitana]
MKIGELIELLTAAAAELPEGLDSQVHVHICRGRDAFSIVTKEVTVDTSASVALVQGHPHRDDGPTVRRPVAMGVDDELARLVEDPAARHEEPPSSVMIQIDETKAYRVPLRADGKILAPGHLDALRVGCLCDPEKNNFGRGVERTGDNVALIFTDNCPVHQTVTLPDP